MSTPECFPTKIFTLENNFCGFLFACLGKEILPKEVYSEIKEFAPTGANSFL